MAKKEDVKEKEMVECPDCYGNGTMDCPDCDMCSTCGEGGGQVDCDTCDGAGEIEKEEED